MAEQSAVVNFLSEPATLVGLGVLAVGTAYYMATRPQPTRISIPRDNQSIELAGGVRVSQYAKDGKLIEYIEEDSRTVYELFQRGLRVSNNGPCLGWRPAPTAPYSWITYEEVHQRARALGSGMTKIGLPPGQDTFIGVFAPNCVPWVVTELSCYNYSRIIVPLYDTLGKDALTYILKQTELTCIVCARSKLPQLAEQVTLSPHLRIVILMCDDLTDEERQQASSAKLEVYSIKEVEEKGRDDPVDQQLCRPEDTAVICYTSGTTGDPKGAILTHANVVSNVAGTYKQIADVHKMGAGDVHISYLPLAHMMERVIMCQLFSQGCQMGFYQGDVKTLVDDIKALRPTIFVSVPRLLNRVYDKIVTAAESSTVKKWLFYTAFNSKLKEVQNGIIRRNSVWDYIVFGTVQKTLGGRVRFILSGSAPISSRVMDFLRVVFGCEVFEGYGQTEGTACATLTLPGETAAGHVGPPIPSVSIKLIDVPDMNYYAANGEGEVCFRGPGAFKGYFKDEEKTKETIDSDGWVLTGDVGRWLPNGALKIIDRRKHIFKLSQGEYIAPEKVENIYCRSQFVAQVLLYGDSLKSCCVAIVVPDTDVLQKWANDHGRKDTPMEDLCRDPEVKKMILDDMKEVGKKEGLNSLEQTKAIKLCVEPFSVENGFLTPTFKLKRPALRDRFMQDFVEMYGELPA